MIKKIVKMVLISIVSVIVLVVVVGVIFVYTSPQFGAKSKGDQLVELEKSPNYKAGIFHNLVPTSMDMSAKDMFASLKSFIVPAPNQVPDWSIPVEKIKTADFTAADTSLAVTWFGHSAILLEIDGKKIFIDPMLGNAASPLPFTANRFNETLPLPISELPYLDAILISHDHYDHLDYPSIIQLKEKTNHFYVPLGVGAHLRSWGVDADKITEMDWNESTTVDGIKLTATPARHFSGRGLTDRFSTLWVSWVIKSENHNVFFSGDSGYFDGFKTIGEAYGPFDLTMMECGQYDEKWANIHMMPEETAQAHRDLKGKVLMPIHWGMFKLALHSWTDPVERLSKAIDSDVELVTPVVGHRFELGTEYPKTKWWVK